MQTLDCVSSSLKVSITENLKILLSQNTKHDTLVTNQKTRKKAITGSI